MTNPINTNLPGGEKQIIDISGPHGNAYYLIGAAAVFGQKLGRSLSEIDGVIDDMKSGDYDHLVKVFETHFSDHVQLIKTPIVP
jgi:hypothetical protein